MLAGLDRARAGLAADRGIAAIVQRVVGNLVGAQVRPDILGGPVGERAELPLAMRRVLLGFDGGGAAVGLHAAQTRDPATLARQRPVQPLDLAYRAAALALLHRFVVAIDARLRSHAAGRISLR